MDDLSRQYQRWRDAESGGRDDDADQLLGDVFGAVTPDLPVSVDFTARTMQAISAAAAHDARRARRARRLGVAAMAVLSAATIYAGAGQALSLLSTGLVTALEFVVGTVVWLAAGAEGGTDAWSVVSNMARAAGAFVATPAVTLALLALQGIAIAAFVALQRILGSDTEFLK